MTLFLALISLGFWTPTPAFAAELPSIPPLVYNASTSETIILAYAVRYGVDGNQFLATAKCESRLDKNAKGDYMNGKFTSFGVFQIHLPAHPEVTEEQAFDPLWAIDWAAHEFSKGNARIWSCFKLLYPAGGNGT